MKTRADRLENELALELDNTTRRRSGKERPVRSGWRRRRGRNLSERRVADKVVGAGEVRVVEDVVEVGTNP